MKTEYSDDQRDTQHHPHTSTARSNMFSKFLPPPQPPLHHPHPHYPNHLHHQQPPQLYQPNHRFRFPNDSQTSEEADTTATATTTAPTPPSKKQKTVKTATATTAEDGGETIQGARRPRGRPPGSKNKPKPQIVITREPDAPPMSPHIIEIPSGADVVESLTRLSRRRGIGLCVLTASGPVTNVTLRQPSDASSSSGPASGGTITFHGRYELVSLSAVLLQTGGSSGNSQGHNGNNLLNGGFNVSLSAPQGHIVGGKVVGPLAAAGTVYVVAASFNNATYHKLPLDDDHKADAAGQVGSPAESGGGDQMGGATPMYGCHLGGADVIWAPTARPSHQHPPPPY